MPRFSKTIFLPFVVFPILIATHGFQSKNPNASWVEHILGTSWMHFLLEISLTLYIIYVSIHKMKRNSPNPLKESLEQLTEKEKENLIKEWTPEPLVPASFVQDIEMNEAHRPKVVCESKIAKYVSCNGRQYLNMSSYNFLNFVGNAQLEETAKRTIRKYGVGSCGPRGFYGTVDVHLELEEKIAKFMQCEEAILYSYGTATISSAIPAYSKRGDLIFVDDGVNFSIQQGLVVSRSNLKYFRHNDVKHLESLLEALRLQDQIALSRPRRHFLEKDDVDHPSKRRVFLVVEGLYANYGDLCPLPQLVALKKKYKFRIFLDETFSIGVIGRTGRGVTEHFDVARDDIDLYTGSLENALGSTGGFCCGSTFVIDHQRLSGLGYCFSASLPPLLAAAASTALDLVQERPELFDQLRANSEYMHKELSRLPGLSLHGLPGSPLKHLRLAVPSESRQQDADLLNRVVNHVYTNGSTLFITAKYAPAETLLPQPSIRVAVNAELTQSEMTSAVQEIASAAKEVLL
ncbi:hypothetical protein RvY_13924 [Ramazzottius varieornatus]|uniref:Serine palmitoyltransferase 1 n=1 Tax=Ramazzottius varieornatus TaxID=947166 RepID=A0A1D1VPL7_RAMVA|nr:hypothetical protein RvY_13924 [Ramazzottius varieornatus]